MKEALVWILCVWCALIGLATIIPDFKRVYHLIIDFEDQQTPTAKG